MQIRRCTTRFANRRLRVIDKGTIYDVPASLEKLARNIDDGRYGKVTEGIVVLRTEQANGPDLEGFFYGIAPGDTAYVMLERMQKRILGE